MSHTKYYTCGSKSEPEGLTLHRCIFSDTGEILDGLMVVDSKGVISRKKYYKEKEITKARYDALIISLHEARDSNPNALGQVGLVNKTGRDQFLSNRLRAVNQFNESVLQDNALVLQQVQMVVDKASETSAPTAAQCKRLLMANGIPEGACELAMTRMADKVSNA